MSNQLSLFPELEWKKYKCNGKIYRRYPGGNLSYRMKKELEIKVERFIDEYNKKTI